MPAYDNTPVRDASFLKGAFSFKPPLLYTTLPPALKGRQVAKLAVRSFHFGVSEKYYLQVYLQVLQFSP
jgi:hypothetical protein